MVDLNELGEATDAIISEPERKRGKNKYLIVDVYHFVQTKFLLLCLQKKSLYSYYSYYYYYYFLRSNCNINSIWPCLKSTNSIRLLGTQIYNLIKEGEND